jgi:8-oxo-dGTP pyrophosphatase MutT (NUDIX family)
MNNNPSSNTIFEVSLKLVIKNKANEILLLKMPDDSSMAGYFDLPGGRIRELEKSGSLKTAMRREIAEELGKDVKLEIKETPVAVGRHSYISKDTSEEKWIFWILFEALYKSGEIQISPEHKEYEWLKVNTDNLSKLFMRGPLEAMSNYITKLLK